MTHAMFGADTEALLTLAKHAKSLGGQIDTNASDLTAEVDGVEWIGADRERFDAQWSEVDRALHRIAHGLEGMAEMLATEAAEQEICSSPNGHPDLSRYEGLVGGESWDWMFGIQNAGDRLLDAFKDKETTGPSWRSQHPDWKPEDIRLDEASMQRAEMMQGQHGDCWFLSALMSAARQHPDVLARNITGTGQPPGSEGWDVKLTIEGTERTIHVAPDEIGTTGARGNSAPNVFSIYEQAFFKGVDGAPSKIRADNPSAGLQTVLGNGAHIETKGNLLGTHSAEDYRRALEEHRSATICTTLVSTGDTQLVPAHCYEVVGANTTDNTVTLRNPWGAHGGKPEFVTAPADSPYILQSAVETVPKPMPTPSPSPGPSPVPPSPNGGR